MPAPSHALAPTSVRRFRPPRFGLAASRLGESPGPDAEATAVATVDAAYQAGIRLFDASPTDGESERRLGTALRGRPRGQFVVSTEVIGTDAGASVRASSERLGLAVDLVFVRDPDADAIETAYPALEELRLDGVIKAVGSASGDWRLLDRVMSGMALDCVLLAGGYTLLDQAATPLLDRCVADGVSVIVSGALTPLIQQAEKSRSRASVRARRISAVCERYGVSLPQAALAFPARHPAVTTVLIAAARPAELRSIAALVRRPVPEALWQDPDLLELLS